MENNKVVNSEQNDIIIEDAFKRLEEISKDLENPDTGLKDSLGIYSEAVKLLAKCKSNLEGVEKEIQILNEV